MKILIDECAPRELNTFLSKYGHQCVTVQDKGWSGKQNGELLALAESVFDVLVTVDANIEYQQNLADRNISVVVLICRPASPLSPMCNRDQNGPIRGCCAGREVRQ